MWGSNSQPQDQALHALQTEPARTVAFECSVSEPVVLRQWYSIQSIMGGI